MEGRVMYCKDLAQKILTPRTIQGLLLTLRNAVTRAIKEAAPLKESLARRSFGTNLVYAVHSEFILSQRNGLFPSLIIEAPTDGRTFPDYNFGGLTIQPYRLKRKEKFPKRSNYREEHMNSSQALLFSLDHLRTLGHNISPYSLNQNAYAFLLYRGSIENGLTMAKIGFPLSAVEGPGWAIPPINLLSDAVVIDTDNSYEAAKPILRPGIIKKQGTDNALTKG